ncbi:MAG: LysM peptidoglycan-binding domain-containing protein [Prevotellaceae bacterium]|nr:LysM peptidoglycan-binding domain-containing protein [Prevotellaceae bacterium]
MKEMKLKIIMTTLVMLFSIALAVAQTNTIKHTVERGETLASIAEKYGTTEAKIIELNPDAAQFVYVGMELNVPMANHTVENETDTNEIISNTKSNNKNISYLESQDNEISISNTKSTSELTPLDFCYLMVSYFSSFDVVDQGYYMLGGSSYSEKGWGVEYYFGANYGLVESDYAGTVFLIGPSYGYVYDKILCGASLDFMGSYVDSKFNWGITFMPKMIIHLGKIAPLIGINAIWAKGSDKLTLGFQVGLGFNI